MFESIKFFLKQLNLLLTTQLLPTRQSYPGLAKAKRKFNKIRAKFYGDFADSIEDGANPFELFSRRYARAKLRHDALAPLYALWRDRASTMNLRKSWEGTIPSEDLLVVGAGERGNLPETLRFLARVVIIRDQNKSAIILAISLPAFLMLLMMGIQMGVALGMIPIMVQIMPPEDFPLLGKMLYHVSKFVVNFWYLVYGIPFILAGLFFWSLPRWTGRARQFLDPYPPYSIYRDVRSSEFLVSLAALTEANISTFDAVSLMMKGTTPWMRRHLARIRLSLRSDHDVTKAMDTGLFSEEIFDRISEYAERSNFEKGVRKIGLTTIEEVAIKISQRSALMRNVLIVAVGGFILFTVASMLQIGQAASEQAQRMM